MNTTGISNGNSNTANSHSTALPSITDTTFAEATGIGTGLVAVDFTAEWCAPCRLMKPVLQALAAELGNDVRIVQLDADNNPATLVRLGVRGLPTILVFRDGHEVDRIVGAQPAARLRERLSGLIASTLR